MCNRISQYLQAHESQRVVTPTRPQLTLHMDRPFKVDMESFFDLSFSFAEVLLDLEEKYESEPRLTTLDRLLAKPEVDPMDAELDVDVRWM